MNKKLITIITVSLFAFIACGENDKKETVESQETNTSKEVTPKFQNKGHELVYKMVQKVGSYEQLKAKNDVVYTYTYTTPDGKSDISTEKYLFDGELSNGSYISHERTLPNLEGEIEQSYDGESFWLKNNGELVEDPEALKKVAFNRPTNFYWFAMMQKLLDEGLNYEHIGEKTIEQNKYDIVKVSFTSVDNKPTDIYQLYINQSTSLVDQFLFTVADFGVMEIPNLMQLEYVEVDDFLLPAKRKYKKSNWEAEVSDQPWVTVTWSDIKFNNKLTKEAFKK